MSLQHSGEHRLLPLFKMSQEEKVSTPKGDPYGIMTGHAGILKVYESKYDRIIFLAKYNRQLSGV